MNKLLKPDSLPRPVNPDIQPRPNVQQPRPTNPYLQPLQQQPIEYVDDDSDMNSMESNSSNDRSSSNNSMAQHPTDTVLPPQTTTTTAYTRHPLPSISTLMGQNADRMLPPIRSNRRRQDNGR